MFHALCQKCSFNYIYKLAWEPSSAKVIKDTPAV